MVTQLYGRQLHTPGPGKFCAALCSRFHRSALDRHLLSPQLLLRCHLGLGRRISPQARALCVKGVKGVKGVAW